MTREQRDLESLISGIEAQRAHLGDAATDAALAPLRGRLSELRGDELSTDDASSQTLRQVTVLFLDVVDSTILSRQLDPEDVHAVLDGLLRRSTEIVEQHRGKVLQYAGDSLLAVFGADAAHEDDAERAIRAGLSLLGEGRRHAERVRRDHGIESFDVRAGIHTGSVLLGGGVHAIGSIRGLTVSIAARMEQTAPPGALRISHSTYRQVRGVFDIQAQPPIHVKGLDEPVVTYLVLRTKPRAFRSAARGLGGTAAPMVGREKEMACLRRSFEAVLQQQSLKQITVLGEAGLGKSRLLEEIERWIDLCSETVWLFHGRAASHGQGTPYGLLRDLLTWRFEIEDGDTQAAAQVKLASGFALFGERAEEQTALVGQLIGLDFRENPHIAGILSEPGQIRGRAFHAMSEFFRLLHEKDGSPVAMLLDDLHWADEGPLDFIEHLARTCRDIPMWILCLARPMLQERRPSWGGGAPGHEQLELGPLSRAGSSELAYKLLERLECVPAAVSDLLAGSAEGNPYFIEEIIGMMLDERVIVAADAGPWHVAADRLPHMQVPSTLTGVLQSRLDALPPEERALLQNASVTGPVFWDTALPGSRPALDNALAALVRRGVILRHPSSIFEGSCEFTFRHHLLHQTAYDTVLRPRRRTQHRRTAEWLIRNAGDRLTEYLGLIGDHYARAGDTVMAVDFLRRAGVAASQGCAYGAAHEHLDRALALNPEANLESRFALLLARVDVLGSIGDRVAERRDLSELETLAEVLDADEKRAQAAQRMAGRAVARGDFGTAAAAAARAVEAGERAGEPEVISRAHLVWAQAAQRQGDLQSAQVHVEEALRVARTSGHPGEDIIAINQLGALAADRRQHSASRRYYEDALVIARATRNRALELQVLNNLICCTIRLGRFGEAIGQLDSALAVCRETGLRRAEPYLLGNLALSLYSTGDSRSLAVVQQAITVAHEIEDRSLEGSFHFLEGQIQLACGDLAAAESAYRRSLSIHRAIGQPHLELEPSVGLARLALATGAIDVALERLADALRHLDGGGSLEGTEDPCAIYLTLYRVLDAAGQRRGREYLTRAYTSLMAEAQLLDPADRSSFLENIASHREVTSAWVG